MGCGHAKGKVNKMDLQILSGINLHDIVNNKEISDEIIIAAIDRLNDYSKQLRDAKTLLQGRIIERMKYDNATKLPFISSDGLEKIATLSSGKIECNNKNADKLYAEKGFNTLEIGDYIFRPSWSKAKEARKVGGENQKIIDDLFKSGEPHLKIDDIIKKNMKVGELYSKARELAIEGKPLEGIKVLEHEKTVRDLVIHGNAIQKNLRQLAVKRRRPDYTIDDFQIDFVWDRTKTLILWGPTNMGKTSLALDLLPEALLVGHKDKLKLYENGEHNGIIYDDMSFLHWPREAQLHLVDYEQERDIDVKHSMVTIPAKTPKIMTTNKMPAEMILANDPAIARRIQIEFIDKRLSKVPRTIDELLEEVDTGDAFAWVRERNRNRQSEFRSGEEEEVDLHQIQFGASSLAAGAGEGQP